MFGRCELVGHVFEIWGGGEWKPKEGSRARCKWKSSKEAGSNLNNTQIKKSHFFDLYKQCARRTHPAYQHFIFSFVGVECKERPEGAQGDRRFQGRCPSIPLDSACFSSRNDTWWRRFGNNSRGVEELRLLPIWSKYLDEDPLGQGIDSIFCSFWCDFQRDLMCDSLLAFQVR